MDTDPNTHIITPGSNPEAKTHVVQAGEHIGMIAAKYGFIDYKEVWEHGENASLRNTRENPFTLAPGDEVYVPEKAGENIRVNLNERNIVKLKLATYQLRIKCLDLNREAIHRNCFFEKENGDVQMALLTGDIYSTSIDATGSKMEMQFPPETGLPPKDDIPLEIGALEDRKTERGQQQRLNNLGYCAGYDDQPKKDDPQFKWAVEEFQCDNGLVVDGKCGPKTQEKLLEVHGI